MTVRISFLLLGLCTLASADEPVCQAGPCGEAEVEALEAGEVSALSVELLQHATKVQTKSEVRVGSLAAAVPYWCLTIDAWTRTTIPSCMGGAGGCVCLGPEVCGLGPIIPGSWQSYSYSCCACGMPAVTPVPVVPVPAVHVPAVPPPAPAAPPVAPPAPLPQALCSAHAECKKLGLDGACCPADGGAMLGCCDVVIAPAAAPAAPLPHATPVVYPVMAATGKTLPQWCQDVPQSSRSTVAACTGAGITQGGCECLGLTVCLIPGAPKPGSWQSYSSACCGCK